VGFKTQQNGLLMAGAIAQHMVRTA